MLDEVRSSLRISDREFDIEILGLIEACKQDLELSGIASSHVNLTDNLIKRAVINYCKAEFGYDNPDSEKFRQSYESIKTHLAISYMED